MWVLTTEISTDTFTTINHLSEFLKLMSNEKPSKDENVCVTQSVAKHSIISIGKIKVRKWLIYNVYSSILYDKEL